MRRINNAIVVAVICLACILISGCGNAAAVSSEASPVPAEIPPTSAPPATANSIPAKTDSVPLKTEVVYFHLTQRCASCICFESRIKYVINTYYQEAVKNGDMSFTILNAQDKKNTDAVKKFGAVGTQLFVNTIVNGTDHIRNVQEIWDWNCNNDPEGFMNKVRDVIDSSLAGKY